MLAIIEIDPSTREVKALKFSNNIAEVDSTRHIHVLNINEQLDTSYENFEVFKNRISLLMNNPQSLTIQSTSGTRGDLNEGQYIEGLPDSRDHGIGPFSRELSQEDKASISVRSAAHRAGQASFFGNL